MYVPSLAYMAYIAMYGNYILLVVGILLASNWEKRGGTVILSMPLGSGLLSAFVCYTSARVEGI